MPQNHKKCPINNIFPESCLKRQGKIKLCLTSPHSTPTKHKRFIMNFILSCFIMNSKCIYLVFMFLSIQF